VNDERILQVPPCVKIPALLKDSRRGRGGDRIVDLEKALERVAEGRYQNTGTGMLIILTTRGALEMRIFRRARKLRIPKSFTQKQQKHSLRGLTCRMSPRKPGTGGRPGDSGFERLLDALVGKGKRKQEAQVTLQALVEAR